jgi:hypothetical protein
MVVLLDPQLLHVAARKDLEWASEPSDPSMGRHRDDPGHEKSDGHVFPEDLC